MKSLKQNYDKHLVITLIVLVALPILLISSTFILTNEFYQDKINTFFVNNFKDINLGFQFLISLSLLQYMIFAVMLIFYPLYPFIFSIENHFSKRNPKSALTEYQVLKKIVYTLLPIFFFGIVLRILSGVTEDNPLSALMLSLDEPAQLLFLSILAAVLLVLASALLRIILLNRFKHFKFYLAMLSFRAMSRIEDNAERVKYLIDGLSFYNKYIRRILRVEVNNRKITHSIITTDATVDRNPWVKELSQAFEDNDKLKPIRCLTQLFNVTDPEHFLVKESVGKKFEEKIFILGSLGSFIAVFVSAAALYIQIITKPN
jgi:hypothetical protein